MLKKLERFTSEAEAQISDTSELITACRAVSELPHQTKAVGRVLRHLVELRDSVLGGEEFPGLTVEGREARITLKGLYHLSHADDENWSVAAKYMLGEPFEVQSNDVVGEVTKTVVGEITLDPLTATRQAPFYALVAP